MKIKLWDLEYIPTEDELSLDAFDVNLSGHCMIRMERCLDGSHIPVNAMDGGGYNNWNEVKDLIEIEA